MFKVIMQFLKVTSRYNTNYNSHLQAFDRNWMYSLSKISESILKVGKNLSKFSLRWMPKLLCEDWVTIVQWIQSSFYTKTTSILKLFLPNNKMFKYFSKFLVSNSVVDRFSWRPMKITKRPGKIHWLFLVIMSDVHINEKFHHTLPITQM